MSIVVFEKRKSRKNPVLQPKVSQELADEVKGIAKASGISVADAGNRLLIKGLEQAKREASLKPEIDLLVKSLRASVDGSMHDFLFIEAADALEMLIGNDRMKREQK